MNGSFLKTNNGTLTVFYDGNMLTVNPDHPNYAEILKRVRSGEFYGLSELFNIAKGIAEYTFGKVVVKDCKVWYGTHEINNTLVDRIIEGMRNGVDYERFIKFLDKLLENPSNRSLEQLYNFLKHNSLAIAEDGDFYAYKGIREDWKDCYTGSIDNSVGKTINMPRNLISDDPQKVCHRGLHIGTESFARGYGSRLIKVKVNPKDVVSVPYDFDSQKCRTCSYFVESEVQK
jgi:hypothetical protein